MKLFENIAEYHSFKRKYEMMGQLEEERLFETSRDPSSIGKFLQFMEDMRNIPANVEWKELQIEEELQTDIQRQLLLYKLSIKL